MKKVLIITYFFPPSTFTGSYRVFSWAKYLSEFGYYPVIVTRNWDKPISNYQDMSVSTKSNKIHHEKYKNYEVYYLPYKGNFRDKLYEKHGDKKFVFLRKFLTTIEVTLQNVTGKILPYYNLLSHAEQLLKNDKTFVLMVTSAKPYGLFNFCYHLADKFKIKWIADYRDDWNTSEWLTNLPIKHKLLTLIEKRSELKWLSNAVCFTTISPNYVKKISAFLNKPGYTVMNGFDPDDYKNLECEKEDKFLIVFNGTLYDTQPVEIFIEGFKQFISQVNNPNNVKLLFLGLNFEKKQAERIHNLLSEYKHLYEVTDRVEKQKAMQNMASASVFLMISHNNIQGVTSSKIFDYLAIGKPVILCPSDNDILEEIVVSTESGCVCNSKDDINIHLNLLYKEFLDFGYVRNCNNQNKILQYSRRQQTKTLAETFDQIIQKPFPVKTSNTTVRSVSFGILSYCGYNSYVEYSKSRSDKVSIMVFHSITPYKNYAYPPLHPKYFEKIVSYLVRNFEITTLSQLNEKTKSKKPLCVLTFDDGYKDFIEYALPVLDKFKIPAVQNIVVETASTGKPIWTVRLNSIANCIYELGRNFSFSYNQEEFLFTNGNFDGFYQPLYSYLLHNSMFIKNDVLSLLEDRITLDKSMAIQVMNWSEIKQCVDFGIEIGSHTVTHETLSTINDLDLLNFEIVKSKEIIASKINLEVSTFAFPNGFFNLESMKIALQHYNFVLGTREKSVKLNRITMHNSVLPRISVNQKSVWENIAKINGLHSLFKRDKNEYDI